MSNHTRVTKGYTVACEVAVKGARDGEAHQESPTEISRLTFREDMTMMLGPPSGRDGADDT